MVRKSKGVPVKRITIDIPIDLYKKIHIAILMNHDSVYGYLRVSIIEGLKLWLKKQKKLHKVL